jgi:hypothetical protein
MLHVKILMPLGPYLTAGGAITVGAVAVTGNVTAGGALTVGAGTKTSILHPSGVCTGLTFPLP